MAYLPNSDADRDAMLRAVGAGSTNDLFAPIPDELLHPDIQLPEPMGEQDLVATLQGLAAANRPLTAFDSFLGAGVYQRFIPAIVRAAISQPEFYTAYTPYQAEASQGTLQSIFEFQSMICALTGLDVANASMYDGATAAAEAMVMAVNAVDRARFAVAATVHPETLRVIRTYAEGRGIAIDVLPEHDGHITPQAIAEHVTSDHAGVLLAQPSFLGTVDDAAQLVDRIHERGALALCAADLVACAVLVSPGDAGFDIAAGDGQPLGIPMSYGGPHLGYIAAREELVRRMPGRLAGLTVDTEGRRAFTLTLQAREQHIRRERATSNICTNHALMAFAATVHMAHMGAGGLRRIAIVSAQRAHHLAQRLDAECGLRRSYPTAPFLWEFVVECGDAAHFAHAMRERGIIAGLPLARVDPARPSQLLVCCTEMTTPAAIARYLAAATELRAAHAPLERVPVEVS
ncbi:MAG: aminomethyl-transferring glycine dehydrogenase subunit GcvPA [Candidatus Dormibacteria bacterium]